MPSCVQVLDRVCAPETVTSDTTRSPMSSAKPPRKPDSALGKKRQACSNPARSLMAIHIGPVMMDLLTSGSDGKDMIPEAWHFVVTSCLRAATRNPRPTTTSTQNLVEYENPKRTFHNTTTQGQRNSLRFSPVLFNNIPEAGDTQPTP